jgi:parvulin-like peptidyl-prolyl isomerase
MKTNLLLVLAFISIESFSQSIKEQLLKVNTIEEAQNLAVGNPLLEAELLSIHPEIENDAFANKVAESKAGEIFSDLNFTYKILIEKNTMAFRVSYIFIDANKIVLAKIEKLRNTILKEYNKGIPFSDLANKYTMDSNKNGDLGWFAEGMMVPEFETAVKNHNQNEIFKVDVANEKWYYIVLKTYNDKPIRELTVLKLNNNN